MIEQVAPRRPGPAVRSPFPTHQSETRGNVTPPASVTAPAEEAEAEAGGLTTWQKVGFALVTGTTIIAPIAVHEAQPTTLNVATPVAQDDSAPAEVSRQWEEATTSDDGQPPPLVLPQAGDAPAPALTIEETRNGLSRTTFPPVNPYAASILADVWARKQGKVEDQKVKLENPAFPHHKFTVGIGLENGPHAPMLLILPGIHGSSTDSKVKALERMALENGMNYTEIPNPMSNEWQKDRPVHEPGNPAWESQVIYDMLGELTTKYPAFYEKVSVTGYSYGAMLSASLVRYELEHPAQPPIINGSVVALSPPMQLLNSMDKMDHLRDGYQNNKTRSVLFTALDYKSAVKKYGYDHIMDSPIARETNYTTEEKIVDDYGSRQGEADMMDRVDEDYGINLLPLDARMTQPDPPGDEEWARLAQQQMKVVQNYTYRRYVDTYLAHDPWFAQNHTTPTALVEDERYSNLLKDITGHGIPILTLTSADDYILKPQDVQDFRQLQQSPAADQVTRVFDYGGHTGLFFSPAVRQSMMDFLKAPPPTEIER